MQENDIETAATAAANAANMNPLRDLFDAPHFEPVENPREYPNRDGSRVTDIANVFLPLKGTNIVVSGGRIRLRQRSKTSPAYAELAFRAGVGLKPLDDAAASDLLDFRRWIAQQYAEHTKGAVTIGVSAAGIAIKASGWSSDEAE